jgi:hypothetical protein
MGLDKTSLLLIKQLVAPHASHAPQILVAGRPKVFFSKRIASCILPDYPFDDELPYYGESLLAHIFSTNVELVHVLDRCDFEGASISLDLGQTPLFSSRRRKYDVVLDLGTSEHVSSPVNSVLNLISFVKPGGLYLCVTPHSNFPDHGLVTFSRSFFESLDLLPELRLLNHLVYKESLSNAPRFIAWDCDTDYFRSHLPGINGSCFSNVLSFLNIPTNHFVLYKVVEPLSQLSTTLGSINQLVYLRRYGDDSVLQLIPDKYRSTKVLHNSSLLNLLMRTNLLLGSLFILFFYMKAVRFHVTPR